MNRFTLALLACSALAGATLAADPAEACCPAPPSGKPVVNADQTVILVWDAASKTQHFIRRASFSSGAEDFGFLVPSPSTPELEEAGDDAFPLLAKITEPEVIVEDAPSSGCGCLGGAMRSKGASYAPLASVTVLEEKTVAGFHAVVLEASSAGALVGWLEEHGYAFSAEVEAWAKPYVDQGWKITALSVTKRAAGQAEAEADKRVAAAALRMSFKTERPLFPYREPDTSQAAPALGADSRLLRIFFIGDARYEGKLEGAPWTGTVAWSGKLAPADRERALAMLKIAPATTPREWWLTEFEDPWPYRLAPSDLYFSVSPTQDNVEREPIIQYAAQRRGPDVGWLGLVGLAALRRRRKS
jgi:hypothetical protein